MRYQAQSSLSGNGCTLHVKRKEADLRVLLSSAKSGPMTSSPIAVAQPARPSVFGVFLNIGWCQKSLSIAFTPVARDTHIDIPKLSLQTSLFERIALSTVATRIDLKQDHLFRTSLNKRDSAN